MKRPAKISIGRRALRLTVFAASLLLAAALTFSAYGGTVDPQVTSIGAIAAMLFPALLVLSVVALAIELIWFRPTAMVTGLSLLVSAGPILTYCPMHMFHPSVGAIKESGKPVIKVMTYNMLNLDDFSNGFCRVGGGNPTLAYVLEENPDIMVCQEGQPMFSDHEKNISAEQHERLFARYPYRYLNSRGMGIVSRFPFEVKRIEHPDRWLYDVYRYDVAITPRDTIAVFNLHLQSLGLTADDKELYHHLTSGDQHVDMTEVKTSLIAKLSAAFRQRAVQAGVVRAAVDSVGGKTVLVCGDFNDIPGCYAQRVIQGDDLDDAYRKAGFGPAITYHADRFFFRIDHILYRGDLKPLRVECGSNMSSDHYPLIAYFELLQPDTDDR